MFVEEIQNQRNTEIQIGKVLPGLATVCKYTSDIIREIQLRKAEK